MSVPSSDFLIIGGGVIGLSLALLIKQRYYDSRVTIVEKEKECGLHGSGRNSGVLHAGFYYTADSLKARFTRDGNRLMTEYCLDRNLPINQCGKLVVARNGDEIPTLEELLRRGEANGVVLHELTTAEAREIEPRVKTFEKALYSPTTSSIDPKLVIKSFIDDARKAGIAIMTDTAYYGRNGSNVVTSQGKISAGYVVNAAGLYADKVAQDYGFSQDYRIIPFKGLFLYSDEPQGALKTHIYPVPRLENPFLGVHFTVTVDGRINVGPTAIPAFWREHYKGLENFNFSELVEIGMRELGLFIRNDFGFRSLAFEELANYYKPRMVAQAAELAAGVFPKDYRRWGPAGIRAQLINIKQKQLEMDFYYEGDRESFHVLNAVSPAFTCSLSFSRHIMEQITTYLN